MTGREQDSVSLQLEKDEDSWARRSVAGDYTHTYTYTHIHTHTKIDRVSSLVSIQQHVTCEQYRSCDLNSRGASFWFDREAQGDPAAESFLQALLYLSHLQLHVNPLLLLLPAVLLHLV